MTIVFAVFLKTNSFSLLVHQSGRHKILGLMLRGKCFKDDPVQTGSGPGRSLALSVCRQPPQTAGKALKIRNTAVLEGMLRVHVCAGSFKGRRARVLVGPSDVSLWIP